MDFIKDSDAQILYKRYDNIVSRMYYGLVERTKFLNPYEAKLIISILNREGLYYKTFKSHKYAERVIIYFSTNDFSIDDYIEDDLAVLEIDKFNYNIAHPDVLGSLMSLGIDRENIGEIIITDRKIQISLLKEVSDYIYFNLLRIKNYKVKPSYKGDVYLDENQINLSEKHLIVTSMRLDVVVAATFNISRSNSKKIIQSEQVRVNYIVENNPSVELDEGDIVVVRRQGKIKIGNEVGKTRKDKHRIYVYVYE